MANTSACRQNFHVDVEIALNKQIKLELYASHVYLTIASYFDQDDVALKGFHKFFKDASDEEREHGEKMIKYLNMRGGRLVMKGIEDPPSQENYSSPLLALQFAMYLEKKVNQALLNMHNTASVNSDPQFCDFLEGEFLKEQVESMKKISDLITNVKRVGTGLGVYMLDKELQS